jgi:hypothetical protein
MSKKKSKKKTAEPRDKFMENLAEQLPELAQVIFNIAIATSGKAKESTNPREFEVAGRIRGRLQDVIEKEFSRTDHSLVEAIGVLFFTAQFLRESKLPLPKERIN